MLSYYLYKKILQGNKLLWIPLLINDFLMSVLFFEFMYNKINIYIFTPIVFTVSLTAIYLSKKDNTNYINKKELYLKNNYSLEG